MILLALILFFAGQVLTVAVVLSVAFMTYVFSSFPPQEVTQRITTYGIRIGKELYWWQELGRFWFDKKHHQTILIIEVARFPNRLTMVLNNVLEKRDLRQVLEEILLHQRPALSWTEKASRWLEKKFPLEIN